MHAHTHTHDADSDSAIPINRAVTGRRQNGNKNSNAKYTSTATRRRHGVSNSTKQSKPWLCVCVVGEWLLPASSQCHTLLRVRFLRSTSRVCEPALPKGFVDGLQLATTLQRSSFAIETGIRCNAKGNNAQAIRDWRGR